MFARALWGNQRKHTTAWDTKYPGKFDSAKGPCVGGRNSHCGAGFVPDANDQAPIDRYIVYHTLHDSRATRFRGANHPSQPRHYLYICLQAPYLPDGHAACGTGAGSEGVFSGPKSGIPWCVSPTLCAMHTQYPLSRIPCRHPSPPRQVYQVESWPVQHLARGGLLGRARRPLLPPREVWLRLLGRWSTCDPEG